MKILLIRHAHAIDSGDGGGRVDDDRWLTDKGRTVARKVGDRLREEGYAPDAIVTSPLVRAVQTAELVSRGLKFKGVVEVLAELAPDGSIRAAAAALEDRGGLVVAVGHEPGISALASHLAGRPVSSFRKGEAVLVRDGKLDYRLDPDSL